MFYRSITDGKEHRVRGFRQTLSNWFHRPVGSESPGAVNLVHRSEHIREDIPLVCSDDLLSNCGLKPQLNTTDHTDTIDVDVPIRVE